MKSKALYFIALIVKGEFKGQVRALQLEMCKTFGVCKSLNSPPHVTLVPQFWLETQKADELLTLFKRTPYQRIKTISSGINHFSDRVIFVEVNSSEELLHIRREWLNHPFFSELNSKTAKKFYPHITIGHRNLKPIFREAWNHFAPYKVEESFILEGPHLLKHEGKEWVIVSSSN